MRFVHEVRSVWRCALMCAVAIGVALEARATESEDWIVPRSSFGTLGLPGTVESVGRIETIDDFGITFEDSTSRELLGIKREAVRDVLISCRLEVDLATLSCLFFNSEGEVEDRIWLRNGDSFSGKLLGVDRRRVRFEAFGRTVVAPRWRVLAIRLGDFR